MNVSEIPVADRPLIRQLAEWPMMIPFAGRVAALQGSHPTVAKGLLDHSTGFTDPLGRIQRTAEYAQRMLFGDDQATTAKEIRDLHRDVKGTGFDGRPYHAWNRDAWTWVHLTTFEALLYGVRAIHGGPPRQTQEALYAHVVEVGSMYGVRAQDMPSDVDGLRAYIKHGIETKLTYVPDGGFAGALSMVAQPSGLPIPGIAWRGLVGAAGRPLELLVAGAFPSTLRKRWGITWTPFHQAAYQSQLVALRAASATLPDRWRMLPYAYRALHQSA